MRSILSSRRLLFYVVIAATFLTLAVWLYLRVSAEYVFINGNILTVDASNPTASALLTRDKRVVAVGSITDVMSLASSSAKVIDLAGRTVVPGFIDAHSHFPVSGLSSVSVNLAPSPLGPGNSKQAVLETIDKAVPKTQAGDKASLILGFNYDNTAFDVPLHPTRQELDAVSRGYPVYLWHSSGHLGVANTAALELLGIYEYLAPVAGGERVLDEAGQLTGLLLEKAAPPLSLLINELSWRDRWRIITTARDEYLAAGVTVVQNGHATPLLRRALSALHTLGIVPQTVHTWLAQHTLGDVERTLDPISTPLKIIVDGSPQGLTAYLSRPYQVPAFGALNTGIALYEQAVLNELVLKYHKLGHQLALHGNGDEAIEQIITAISEAQKIAPRVDARHILVHAQLLRKDQIERMIDIDLTPSFFVSHTYYWGDWHLQTMGESRASSISPTATAKNVGLRLTLHSDTPVTPMDIMFLMWSATQRITRAGISLDADERISRKSALQAVTLDAAWQSFMEDERGSLEPGKFADFVVLSDNPLTAPDLRQVNVQETWIAGRRHYQQSTSFNM